MRISDWSSDVCSSDLQRIQVIGHMAENRLAVLRDDVICRATILSTRNLSEANQIAPGPGRIGAQIDAADHQPQPVVQHFSMALQFLRISSEERRLGKECVSTSSTRW